MSILRVKKEEKYAVISNEPLNNKNLTWEARGIMAYLLSKPDGWECRNYDLVNQGPASDHVIRRVLKELQEAGYIHRYRKSEGRGKIEWVTEIYETPELNTAFRNGTFSSLDNIETESFNLEKPAHIVSTDSLVNTDQLVSTDHNMPLRADNDFSDLLGKDEPQPAKPTNGKPKMTETELAQIQTFGTLPGQDIDPAEYALQQEIIADGWDIYSDDVRQGIIYFTLAVRAAVPDFALPKDTSTRKEWFRDVGIHLKNYSLEQLKDLYKKAIIKMAENNLSFWQPGSLTRWALPEVANTPLSLSVTTGPNLTEAELQRYKELVAANS